MRRIVFTAGLIALISTAAATAQTVTLQETRRIAFPAPVDSNSPAFWENGLLAVYNSTGMGPVKSTGANQEHLIAGTSVKLGSSIHRPYWIEATWTDSNGTIFAWYHHEPHRVCGNTSLTAPEIGALVSYDGGNSFLDMGIILQSGDPIDCSAQNGYFAGGNGDFSVLLSRDQKYFYFLYSNYAGPLEAQGVAVARMPAERRSTPVGAVRKYYDGKWNEPGLGGRTTAIFPANVGWSEADTDALWGPSVHWNSHLGMFVMLLNHSCCSPGWPQEGIYVSYNRTLGNPLGWSKPAKILDGVGWYPQVLGLNPQGTDKLAGRVARLYVGGISWWELTFEPAPATPAQADPGAPTAPDSAP